jgi:hypothetical protein
MLDQLVFYCAMSLCSLLRAMFQWQELWSLSSAARDVKCAPLDLAEVRFLCSFFSSFQEQRSRLGGGEESIGLAHEGVTLPALFCSVTL